MPVTTCSGSVSPRLRPALLLLLLACARPAPAADGNIEDLQQEVRVLRQRVEMLENRLQELLDAGAQAPAAAADAGSKSAPADAARKDLPAVTAAVPPGPDVSIGGRVRFDAVLNSRSVGGSGGSNRADQVFAPASVPLSGSGETNQTSFNARDSRLWVKAHTPTPRGDVSGYLEIDFASADRSGNEKVSNSYTPRLRHAYAEYRGFTLGQTYTTFLNVSAYPETVDVNGPVGILNIRQPLLRYRHPFSRTVAVSAGLEQPETTLTTTAGRLAPDDDRAPDVIGRLDVSGDWGNWSLAALVRQLRIDAGGRDSAWGGAVSAAGRLYVGRRDNLRFSLSYGNALGRYLSYNGFDDGVRDGSGRIELTAVAGGYVSYQHWWNETLRSSFTAGYARADPGGVPAPAAMNRVFYSTHLNLIWSPTLNTSVGLEWLHGYRELEDGRSGNLDRIQFTSTYQF